MEAVLNAVGGQRWLRGSNPLPSATFTIDRSLIVRHLKGLYHAAACSEVARDHILADQLILLSSSTEVVQLPVKEMVVGSIPTWTAI